MNKEYKEELAKLEKRMLDAEAFAEQLPVFKKEILASKLTDKYVGKITSAYKSIYFNWGVNRWDFHATKQPNNYKGEVYEGYLFNIYINTLCLYDSHDEFGLDKLSSKAFYYDTLNSTFYAKDTEIAVLLESLNDWYIAAKESAKIKKSKEKASRLRKDLAELEEDNGV